MTSLSTGETTTPAVETPDFRTFDEFWVHYLGAHRCPRCRALHYVGAFVVLALLAVAAWRLDPVCVLCAPLAYLFAWTGHFVFEGNKPATFGHPFWSLRGEFRMFWLFLTGRLTGEIDRVLGD